MTAADYRAEARAWRKSASRIDAGEFAGLFLVVDHVAAGLIWTSMCERRRAHYAVADDLVSGGHFMHAGEPWHSDIVLACLILALEAEDDARRAER